LWTLGCHHWHQKKTHFHSYEFTYDVSKKTQGIKNHPFFVKFAGQYNLTPNITFKTKWNLGQDIIVENAWIQKVDERMTVICSDEFNLSN